MKKTLLLTFFTLIFSVSFAQVNESNLNDIEKKILKTFKDNYVEKKFKDPYSFKLLKFEVTPITFGEWVLNDLNYCKKQVELKNYQTIGNINFNEEYYLNIISKNEKTYSEMSEDVKNTIKSYKVILDCYGNNSYGNPILGRYKFTYNLYGKDLNYRIDYYNGDNLYVTELK